MTRSNSNGPLVPSGGATGPRTVEHKGNPKFNATTHGIFCGVVVLKGESRSECESVLNGLRDALQPQGTLEEILVDKLAMILWRHRRLILAERGQFLKNKSEFEKQQQVAAERMEASLGPASKKGLVESISNPFILKRCLQWLTTLRDRIQEDGDESASNKDYAILTTIYGVATLDLPHETLLNTYASWLERVSHERGLHEDREVGLGSYKHVPNKDISDKKVLRVMEAEIHRLEEFKKSQRPDQIEQGRQEVLRLSMNEGSGLELLVRYETSLERAFDRTLAQLERVQRIRLGQPVPPRLEIGLNH